MIANAYVNHLTKKQCHCELPEFYKLVAEGMGYAVTENTRYDCRKIQCTEEVEKRNPCLLLRERIYSRTIRMPVVELGAESEFGTVHASLDISSPC